MGYAGVNTDAGHSWDGGLIHAALDSSWWAAKSEGNMDHHLLQLFGHRALEEMTLIAKSVIEEYYGKKIAYSYWNGCSTGELFSLQGLERICTNLCGV